jgi:hypothetical protein
MRHPRKGIFLWLTSKFQKVIFVTLAAKLRKLARSEVGLFLFLHLSGNFTPSATGLCGIPLTHSVIKI